MTYTDIYVKTVQTLKAVGIDSPEYDTRCLIKYFFGIDRVDYNKQTDPLNENNAMENFSLAVKKRAERYPLQYIIKSWSFMDCELSLGEGVLIPNDDTEVCVRECMRLLDEKGCNSPFIIDLCGGSGAISIALAKKYPKSTVISLELSNDAYEYLCVNIKKNNTTNVLPVKGDLFSCCDNYGNGSFDAVISNPPYIRTAEINYLQPEVQYEPVMALDGGEDGLKFYRAICEKWIAKLKNGGIISLETGEEQAEIVGEMLKSCGISDVRILQDISGLDRTVSGIYRIVQ